MSRHYEYMGARTFLYTSTCQPGSGTSLLKWVESEGRQIAHDKPAESEKLGKLKKGLNSSKRERLGPKVCG